MSRGGGGALDPMKNHKIIGSPSNYVADPLKIHKGTKPSSMLGHYWHASETPFKWPLDGGLIDDYPL